MNMTGATLIGQLFSFSIFLYVIWKYVIPPIIDAIESRQATIAEGLMNADQASQDLKNAEATGKQIEAKAKIKSQELIVKTESRAAEMIEKAKIDANLAGEKELSMMQEKIKQEVQQIRDGLRKEMASLIIEAAEQVVGREIDEKNHVALIKAATEKL